MIRRRRFVPCIDRLDLRITPSDLVPTGVAPPAQGGYSTGAPSLPGGDSLLIGTITWLPPTGSETPDQLSSDSILSNVDWVMPTTSVVSN